MQTYSLCKGLNFCENCLHVFTMSSENQRWEGASVLEHRGKPSTSSGSSGTEDGALSWRDQRSTKGVVAKEFGGIRREHGADAEVEIIF